MVATALPTIGHDLHDVENLSWVVTAYLLTATAVTPLYGKLSDIYGRRSMLLLAICIFAVASVGCATAPSMTVLIIARGLQGLGGGGLLSLEEACSRYTLTVDEFLSWQFSIDQHGLAGLRTTRIQQYRQ